MAGLPVVAPQAAHAAPSAAFYRDVLGFKIRQAEDGTEGANGPALLRLHPAEACRAVVFFEIGDIEAAHAALRAGGIAASELVKVNWVKMRMFEIRDPDGNTLWFGQPYDKPHTHQPGMFHKALPRLPLSDLPAGIAHYRDVLAFRVNYQDDQIGVMFRDDVTVLLVRRTPEYTGTGSAYFYIADAAALCADMRRGGARVLGDPVSFPWGLREFSVQDPEGTNCISDGRSNDAPHAILSLRLKHYRILNTRKRVVVALVHTVVFLGVAVSGFIFSVAPLGPASPPSAWVMAAVYTVVSAILLWLTAISTAPMERLYFAFCASSAGFGLLRQLLGDPTMHAAVYVRVAMLTCAVATGFAMLSAPAQGLQRVDTGSAAGGEIAGEQSEGR